MTLTCTTTFLDGLQVVVWVNGCLRGVSYLIRCTCSWLTISINGSTYYIPAWT